MDRALEIIGIISENSSPVTIDYVAGKLGLSNKTVRNDLKRVEEYITGKGLLLDKRPGVGVTIVGDEGKKQQLLNEMKVNTHIVESFSVEARKNYILKRLFMSDENITMKDLAQEMYVSRVTIHKDLEAIEKWLKTFGLRLMKKTNYGVEILGKEENWRNAVAALIAMNKENSELKELLYEEYSGRIDYKTITKLKELINIDYRLLEKIIENAESRLRFKFSDEAFISLMIHVAISIRRLKGNKDVQLSRETMAALKKRYEFQIAGDMAKDIQEAFKVKLPEAEVGYILLHILGAKMQQSKDDYGYVDLVNESDNELAIVMTKEIISIAQRALSVDIMGDQQLQSGLALHLRPTINRLKYGLSLKNPIIKEIKENYPEIFGVAWMTSTVFEKYLGKKINEEEIGYIAIHLGAAVERQKSSLNVIVVCTSGIGTSQLLAAKLERHFRELEIRDVVSAVELKGLQMQDIDFIISTVPIEAERPVVCISPILTQKDIRRLDQFILEVSDSKKRNRDSIRYLMEEDLIDVGAEYRNKAQLLKRMCAKLQEKGYVDSGFYEDAMKREDITPTEVGNGFAIPHGSPSLVRQSKIAITVLGRPIKWGKESVDIVLLICISEDDVSITRTLFKNLYRKIYSENLQETLRTLKSKEEVVKILEGICNDYQ